MQHATCTARRNQAQTYVHGTISSAHDASGSVGRFVASSSLSIVYCAHRSARCPLHRSTPRRRISLRRPTRANCNGVHRCPPHVVCGPPHVARWISHGTRCLLHVACRTLCIAPFAAVVSRGIAGSVHSATERQLYSFGQGRAAVICARQRAHRQYFSAWSAAAPDGARGRPRRYLSRTKVHRGGQHRCNTEPPGYNKRLEHEAQQEHNEVQLATMLHNTESCNAPTPRPRCNIHQTTCNRSIQHHAPTRCGEPATPCKAAVYGPNAVGGAAGH